MSLNQSEQMVFDYVQGHAEERQHWQEKVRQIVRVARDPHAAASSVEAELWRYYRERAGLFGSSSRRSPRMAPNASVFAVSPNTGFVFGAYRKPNRDPLNLVQGKG
jgi:hypothetical protein